MTDCDGDGAHLEAGRLQAFYQLHGQGAELGSPRVVVGCHDQGPVVEGLRPSVRCHLGAGHFGPSRIYSSQFHGAVCTQGPGRLP